MERAFVKLIYSTSPRDLQDKINEYLGLLAKSDAAYISLDIIKDGAKSLDGYIAIIKYISQKEVKE